MVCRQSEQSRSLRRGCAPPNKASVSARAGRQPQSIQQYRFARPRLAGKRSEARPDRQIEGFDQHDVSYGQANQHA